MSEKSKAIFTVSLIIFALSGSFLFNGIVQHDKIIDSMIEITEQDTHYLLEAMNDFTFKTYRWRIQNLIDTSPQIIEAFATRNRKLLYELTSPQYDSYCCENEYLGIMHFHLPDGTTFLRVHKPDFFGDNLKDIRPMINAVNLNHKPLSGFEIGRHRHFYRIVQPIFSNNTYVGALEFGISAYQIIDILESGTEIEAAVFFDEGVWQKITRQQEDQVAKVGKFILTSHNRSLSDLLPKSFQFEKDNHPLLTIDNLTYIVHSHPIFNNFQGKSIGGLILFQDITKIVEQRKIFISQTIILTVGLLVLVIVILYYTFGKIIGALHQREAKLSSIFRAAPAGIGVVVDRVMTEVNEHFCEMMGYAEVELLGKSAKMLYPSDEEYELVGREKYRQICEQGTGTVETHLQRKDGNKIDVLLSSTPLNIDDSSAGVTFTATDITAIKEAHEQLEQREHLLSSIFRAAPTGIGVVVNRVFQQVNKRFCKMLGYSEKELLGKNTRMIFLSDEKYENAGLTLFTQMREHGIGTIETNFLHKDGKAINAFVSLAPLDIDDLSRGLTFVFIDMTEIKNTERKLHQSENRFRAMMESMSDPVYICSDDYHVEYMNPAMVKRIGRDATGEFCYNVLHNFDQPCPWCKSKDEFHGNFFESDIISPKDNHSYHVSHSPIVNEDGSISSMTIFRDTTEFKKMEAHFFQAQKMESIGTLAGGVAHDFNNILTVIRGHAQLGMMKTTEENPLWDDLAEIETAGDRASKLTRQLLAFSRKQAINPEMIQVNSLLNDLKKMLKRLIGEDINLNTDLDKKLSPILADPGQLEQVIINLVVNAADAIKDRSFASGRNISISTSEVLLDNDFVLFHADSETGWHLLLEIADNGCGISKEVLEHVFEPFYTTKEVGKGTGLGLSTVYGIVKQNNASIYIESEPGQGTTFKIYWPSAKNYAPQIIKTEKPRLAHGGNEVIMLVEDEKSTRHLAQTILQHAGYTVIEAENGLDALEKAKDLQGTIDLVFTDVVMPVMGGKELSKKLSTIYPQIKFLFTSGYLGDRVNRDDEIFKNERFINKPYDVPVVLSNIRQLLDNREV